MINIMAILSSTSLWEVLGQDDEATESRRLMSAREIDKLAKQMTPVYGAMVGQNSSVRALLLLQTIAIH